MEQITLLIGRLLMAQIFLLAGLSKISAYEGTQGYMEAFGLPGALLPLVIVFEVGAGLALIAGVLTRYVAWALAAFSVVSALVFHTDFGDQTQMILFMKNLAMAGGLLFLGVTGAGALSLDARLRAKG
jgi:putative oxidoreductase